MDCCSGCWPSSRPHRQQASRRARDTGGADSTPTHQQRSTHLAGMCCGIRVGCMRLLLGASPHRSSSTRPIPACLPCRQPSARRAPQRAEHLVYMPALRFCLGAVFLTRPCQNSLSRTPAPLCKLSQPAAAQGDHAGIFACLPTRLLLHVAAHCRRYFLPGLRHCASHTDPPRR